MIGSDDARLTAYAVDEVDAETAALVEAALRASAAHGAAVEETREAAALVAAVFAAEAALELASEQRQAIAAAAARSDRPPARGLAIGGGLAAAATIALAVLLMRGRSSIAPVPPGPVVATPPAVALATPVPPRAEESVVPAPVPPRRSPAPARRTVTVRGTVTDSSGSAIPGVTVEARSLESGAEQVVTSGADGTFRLEGVSPGPLEVRAELRGFSSTREQVIARNGTVLSWNPTLRVATIAEEVTVTGESPVVDVASTARSTSLSDEFRSELRDAADSEAYGYRADNSFVETRRDSRSTFALDVDTASYSNVRRFLDSGQRPPVDAVRIEELVNYFPYDYPAPTGGKRFAAHLEVAPAPWKPENRLLRIGLGTAGLERAQRPAANFVFLVDVSGSMEQADKLPLVQQSLRLLAEEVAPRDRVAIVVYAGAAGLVLPSTAGDERAAILSAIDRLRAGGSTNGGQGIELAYAEAARHFVTGGVNRVILATDGDFNVGVTDQGSLVRLVQQKAKTGVFLSVLGYGTGNLKDSTMESLADQGNGNYAYIDSVREARKVLVTQMSGTLVTVAKDVKVQVEFNPQQVRAYRLLGYENRLLRPEDFKDDSKDAGEVGAGHTVTALYELVPAAGASGGAPVDPLRYVAPGRLTEAARGGELLHLKLRYKEPEGRQSRQQQWTVTDRGHDLSAASADFRFAASVAAFGMLLRDAPDKGAATFATVLDLATSGLGHDRHGYRAEFVELVKKAQALAAEAEE
jgi:Ca-activated chloride channel homolog